jgi:hypothetical protein
VSGDDADDGIIDRSRSIGHAEGKANHMKTRNRLATALAVSALTGGMLLAATSTALATAPDVHKVTICHRTASQSNPYVEESVDIASSGHLQGGHDQNHNGPLWHAGIVGKWGDVIPAYDYAPAGFHYDGKNNDAAGLALLANHCNFETPEVPVPDVTTEIHLGATDAGTPVVINDANPALTGASTVHDSAMVDAGNNEIPSESSVTFYFFTSHDCSGEPTSSDPFSLSGGAVDPGMVEADLAEGDYSFQAVFTSGNGDQLQNASSDCEPFTVTPPGGKTQQRTDTEVVTGNVQSPTDASWLLIVAFGVLLAGAVVLTPARIRNRR